MSYRSSALVIAVFCLVVCCRLAMAGTADSLIEKSGVQRGVCSVLGASHDLALDLAGNGLLVHVWDSAPESEWVANEMRRDVGQLRENDSFSVMLDTFYDRRNGLAFLVTPIGGFSDFAITNEGGSVNTDWNTIWDSRTARFDGGWSVELQIPFKSLRYRPTLHALMQSTVSTRTSDSCWR